MKIALFTDTFVPKVDGIVTTLCQTVKHLKSLGNEVLIFAPDGGVGEFEDSRVVGMKGRPFLFYPELKLCLPRASMRETLAEFKPDIIHVADPALLGIAGLYFGGGKHGGALHLPLVVSYHTDLPTYLHFYRLGFIEPFVWPLLRLRHNRATRNLCTSMAMMQQLGDHGIKRVSLWPGGVDSERFQPCKRTQAMRDRLTQGNAGGPLILYVGRLSPEKEIERLRPIVEAIPNARLALVGDGPHRKALERHFDGLPVYMAGFLHGEELASAYASSDIFVMPSRSETLGLVVLEAMCSGIPVVAARAGGIPELIEDGVSGYLFDEEDAASATILRLLNSPQEVETVTRTAREHALEHSWKTATGMLVKFYQDTLDQFPGLCVPEVWPAHPGVKRRAKRAMNAATLSVIRKLLP